MNLENLILNNFNFMMHNWIGILNYVDFIFSS